MPLFWHGQLVVLVLQIYIHRILVYSWNDIQKALYPYISFSCVCFIFRCYVMYCNLWYLSNVFYLLILCYSCILMNCCNIQWNVLPSAFWFVVFSKQSGVSNGLDRFSDWFGSSEIPFRHRWSKYSLLRHSFVHIVISWASHPGMSQKWDMDRRECTRFFLARVVSVTYQPWHFTYVDDGFWGASLFL